MKKKKHLTGEQRYQISALLQKGTKQKDIARIVGADESTISRELKRNGSKRGYSANNAQTHAEERKERFRHSRSFTKEKEDFVRDKLENEQWSPEQITDWCRNNGVAMVSTNEFINSSEKTNGKGAFCTNNAGTASNTGSVPWVERKWQYQIKYLSGKDPISSTTGNGSAIGK